MPDIERDLHDEPQRSHASAAEPAASPADVIVRAFVAANGSLRARILNRLLGSVGVLACAVLGGGIFMRLAGHLRAISADDALRISAPQFLDLAGYVEQSNPGVFEQAVQVLLQDPSVLAAIGVSVAAAAMHVLARSESRRG